MKIKRSIITFISFLMPNLSYAADHHIDRNSGFEKTENRNQKEETRPLKKLREEEVSPTQRMALHFIHLLRSNNMRVNKTYLHKFIYFANGLHYSVFNRPLLEGFSFEAHLFGPFVYDVRHYNSMSSTIPAGNVDPIDNDSKAICDFTFFALKQYSACELSRFTHEEGTPWTQTRRRAKSLGEMGIDPEMDKKYFTNPEIIQRFFLDPLFRFSDSFKSSSEVTKKLLENFIITKLSIFKLALQEKRFDDARGLVEQLVDLSRRADQFSFNIGKLQDKAFVSILQTPMEGILSSILFSEGFIRTGQLDLFYNPCFRTRVAISAGLNDLSTIHYLQQIFEACSNNPGDDADQKAQEVQSRLETLANQIISRNVPLNNDWQESYDQSLAHFYLAKYDDAIKWMENALQQVELPTRYRHDLLQRAFYITNDSKYIEQALSNRFQDFYILKATTETSAKQAFICYETAIMDRDLSEAYFKAGQMILQGNYTVPEVSPLWDKMGVKASSGNIQLGTALLERSIKNGVSEALTYYVESYLSDKDKKIAACGLAKDLPFAEHQKGELLESQHKLLEAREAYKAAGELIGYPDAMRLSSLEEQKLLGEWRKEYKQRLLDELYEDYSNYIQVE